MSDLVDESPLDPDDDASGEVIQDPGFEELLRFVRDARGFDFTGYKRTSLGRRVRRRMQEIGIESMSEYRAYLEANLDEFTALFNTILINVTGFFRDAAAWAYLESEIIPRVLSKAEPDAPIRLWSAGCASGEETYTLAMVMANALGVPAATRRVKIYGTDVDLEALAHARSGAYSEKALEDIPEDLRARYFQPDVRGRGFSVTPALRRTIVFGRHDLTRDPPISHVDLLSCRNTLMYLNADTQSVVVPRLHYALRDGGFLFLGRAEMVVHGGSGRFEAVNVKHRVFVALPQAPPPELPPGRLALREPFDLGSFEAPVLDRPLMAGDAQDPAPGAAVIAQLMVTPAGDLVGVNDVARELFEIPADGIAPLRTLRLTAGLNELASAVAQVGGDGQELDLGLVRFATASGRRFELAVRAFPIVTDHSGLSIVCVTLTDNGAVSSLREDFHQMHAELETAYEELQSTNEELVTSNEELQSSYEELETTNEELQSANEELETTNEELRSSNEELEATNIELKSASDSVERMNATLVDANNELNRFSTLHRHVMDNFPSAVVVLDSHLLIEEWNQAATDLWGLREDEVVGEPFFGLDFGLPLEALQDPVRACRSPGASPVIVELDAVNRLGRQIRCRVEVVPATGNGVPPSAMLIMQAVDPTSE